VAGNPEVSAWFKDVDHPLKKPMLEVRNIIMATDRRMTETIKWKRDLEAAVRAWIKLKGG
jgi:hypothetical protein